MKSKWIWAFLLVAVLFTICGAAFGQYGNNNRRENLYQAGYDQGYRDGLRRSEQDSRSNGRYGNSDRDYRDRDYRDNRGYPNTMGRNDEYQKGYRAGYQVGYNNGLRGRGNGRATADRRYPDNYPQGNMGHGPYPDSNQGNYPGGYGGYPDARTPGGTYSSGSRGGYDYAFDRGMERGNQDGLDKGEEDYKKGRSYDLNRHKDYRNADKGYKSTYGDRRDYQAGYRRGFEEGYRRTYRR